MILHLNISATMSRYIFFFVVLLTFQRALSTEQQRGLWIVRHALSEQSEISKIITAAEQLEISDLYIQVRALGYKFYTDPGRTDSTSSPLYRLLVEAKQKNIRTHAWINMMYIWAGSDPPGNRDHIYYKSAKAILRQVQDEGVPSYAELRKENIEGFFLHPTDPLHLMEIQHTIEEVLSIYPFDGVHLDYFRMPAFKYSFSPVGRTRFLQTHFIDPVKVYTNPEKFIAERGRASFLFTDIIYKDFMRKEFRITLEKVREYIASKDDRIILSIAVKPDPIRAKHHYFQDWHEWLSMDLCDQVLMMNYSPDYDEFKKNISLAGHTKMSDRIIVGLATYNQDINDIKRRIIFVSHLDFAGIALFSYNYISKHDHLLNGLSLVMGKGAGNVKNNTRTKGN